MVLQSEPDSIFTHIDCRHPVESQVPVPIARAGLIRAKFLKEVANKTLGVEYDTGLLIHALLFMKRIQTLLAGHDPELFPRIRLKFSNDVLLSKMQHYLDTVDVTENCSEACIVFDTQ
jgi:hypothetical protein